MRKLPQPPKPKKLATKHRRPRTVKPGSRAPNIEAHEYDPKTGHLTVTFAGGRSYRYRGVSAETAAGLADATSKGRYLHANIIGKHDHVKISD